MNALDLRTAVFTGLVINIICTLVMVALWYQNRRHFQGLACWALDFLFQTIGLLLITLRGVVPDWLSIFLANVLVITGALLGYLGLERFIERKGPQAHNFIYLGLAFLAHAYLSFIWPDLTLRTINLMLALVFICAQCAWLMLRRPDMSMRPFTRWVGIVFGVYAAVFILRIAWLLLHPYLTGDYFQSGSLEAIFHVLLQVLFVLLTYSLGLMVNQRLLQNIQVQEEKFATAFRSAPYAIILTRLYDGAILEVNQGFAALTGYAPNEVLGKTTVDLNLWAQPEARDLMVRQLTEQGRVDGTQQLFRKRSGELLTGLFSAAIIVVHGEPCMLSSISDITARQRAEQERERLLSEREQSLSEIKILSGLLPICASCKNIRDDQGYWNRIESYIRTHSQAEFSHGLCPECMQKLYPEFMDGDE